MSYLDELNKVTPIRCVLDTYGSNMCLICGKFNVGYFCSTCTNNLLLIKLNSSKDDNILLDKFCNKFYWCTSDTDDSHCILMGCFKYVLIDIFDNPESRFSDCSVDDMLDVIISLKSSNSVYDDDKREFIHNLIIQTTEGDIEVIFYGFDFHDVCCDSYSVHYTKCEFIT
jgi:hypothetical protein